MKLNLNSHFSRAKLCSGTKLDLTKEKNVVITNLENIHTVYIFLQCRNVYFQSVFPLQ